VAASGNKLIIGGYVPQHQLRTDQSTGVVATKASAEELCASHFFNSVVSTISEERRVLKRQGIAFFFDHSTNKEWRKIVIDDYNLSRERHRQFKAITFVSQGLRGRAEAADVEFLPLQAADMVAYRLRQMRNTDAEKYAILRRVFVVPEGITYEQAMQSIKSKTAI